MKKYLLIPAIALLLGACAPGTPREDSIVVTIEPLRYIVEGIVGDDFPIEVLVPPGASPETFEPTPRQMARLSDAEEVFAVGLVDFERNLLRKAAGVHPIDLSRGIELISGSCSHAHLDHTHGVDPHIWTSPPELRIMARNAYEAIAAAHPDSTKYRTNYEALDRRLAQLDSLVGARIAASGIESFIIYHPALSYYARAYGLRQVAIEEEGKEPSARALARIIDQGRNEGVRRILYQAQFPRSVVEVMARDLDAQAAEIDPLRADVYDNILSITDLIVNP